MTAMNQGAVPPSLPSRQRTHSRIAYRIKKSLKSFTTTPYCITPESKGFHCVDISRQLSTELYNIEAKTEK